jgi:uncharacterized protein YcfJ
MDKQLVVGFVVGALALTAITAVAGYRVFGGTNYADVIAVKPVMETVGVPREECRDELVTRTKPTKDPNQIAGTVAGAVIGGVLGNQIGDGNGKKVATVGGAAAGGYAGNKIQEGMQERNTYQESQRTCETVNDSRQEQAGYEVTYRLDGRNHVVSMDHDPGKRIPIENGAPVLKH